MAVQSHAPDQLPATIKADIFCEDCSALLTKPLIPSKQFRLTDRKSLSRAIAASCKLCTTLYEAWSMKSQQAYFDTDELREYALQAETLQYWVWPRFLREDEHETSTKTVAGDRRIPCINIVAIANCSSDDSSRYAEVVETAMQGPLHIAARLPIIEVEFKLSLIEGRCDNVAGRPMSEHVDLGDCKKWVDDCMLTHTACPRPLLCELPKRVIDVGDSASAETLRLVHGRGLRAQYNALSHCWGARPPLKTTSATLESHLEGIPWIDLPKSFQDAVVVIRYLGYRYLWVDSLCIVQDDPTDWREQLPQMVSIYSNAAVTIAASGAKDAYEGFLKPRALYTPSATLYVDSGAEGEHAVVEVSPVIVGHRGGYDDADSHSRHHWREEPPILASRAWAFKERLLSPRLLHFGTARAYFECNTHFACEGIAYPTENLIVQPRVAAKNALCRRDSVEDVMRSWYRMIEEYSTLFLTYEDDKLPSLAGLAKNFEAILGDEYCAGLWRSRIIEGCMWSNRKSKSGFELKPSKRRSAFPAQSYVPSWSWASCDYPHQSDYSHVVSEDDVRWDIDAEVVDVRLHDARGTRPGLPAYDQIIVRGRLKTGVVDDALLFEDYQSFPWHDSNARILGLVHFDDPDVAKQWRSSVAISTPSRKRAQILLLAASRAGDNAWKKLPTWIALLMEPLQSPGSPLGQDAIPTYRRVGLCTDQYYAWLTPGDFPYGTGWFDDGLRTTIRIV